MAKFGTILFGTDPIKYGEEAGPGAVLSTRYNYDDDSSEDGSGTGSNGGEGTGTSGDTGTGVLKSFTDPFGKIFRYGKIENGNALYYPNNTFTERTYDQQGRLKTIAHKRRENDGSATTLESFSYQYDDTGNITKITQANGEYTDYNYDNLNRLTEEHRKTSTGDSIYKIEYKFDNNQSKNGNIHQVTVNDTDTTTFAYNEMNELTGITHPDSSAETLTYDDNGNLTQTTKNGEIISYEWDCFDRLTKVTLPAKGGATSRETVEFEYDSDGMLIGEKSAGMERKFTQQNRFAKRELVKNRNGEWEMSAYHTIHGQMLATHISSNSKKAGMNKVSNESQTIFYHTDHLGSVRLTTDQNGNTIDSNTTDAYGNPLPHAAANPDTPPGSPKNKGAKMLSNFNFIGTHGIRYVEKVKLHNMRARWYVKKLNRFPSPDLLISDNLYAYAKNNSVKNIDASGLFAVAALNENSFNIFVKDEADGHKDEGYKNELISYHRSVLNSVTQYITSPKCVEAFSQYGPNFKGNNIQNVLSKWWGKTIVSFLFGDADELKRGINQNQRYIMDRGYAYSPIEYLSFNKIVLDFDYISGTFGQPRQNNVISKDVFFRTAMNVLIHEFAHLIGVPGQSSKDNKFFELHHFCCELIAWDCLGMAPGDRTWFQPLQFRFTVEWVENIIGLNKLIAQLPTKDLQVNFGTNWNDYKKYKDVQAKSPNLEDRRKFYGQKFWNSGFGIFKETQIGPTSIKNGRDCCKGLKDIKDIHPFKY